MTLRLLLAIPLLAALAALAGCIDFMGFPPSYLYDDDDDDDEGGLFSDEEGECTVSEREPNDWDEDWEIDSVGLLEAGKRIVVCGEISDTGVDHEGYYTGDMDYFLVEILRPMTVRIELDAEPSGAYYDLWMLIGEDWIPAWSLYQEDTLYGDMEAGQVVFMVVGFDGPSGDYQVTVRPD